MLNGQNHKGSTYHIGKELYDKLSGENEIKEFFFPSDLNHFCVGCYKCIEDMSAPLKSFFDLSFDLWMSHRPLKSMFSKRAVIISTSAGSSPRSAMKDVEDCLFYMGVPWIHKYGIAVQAMNWDGVSDEKKKKIDKDIEKLARTLSKNKLPVVHIKTRFIFMMMSLMQKKGWNSSVVETKYWEDNGWLSGTKPWKEDK